MQIGVLARRAGVSCSRIRFYEAHGVLPSPVRLPSGYRAYDDRALETLMFIDRARALGFSLREIAAHVRAPERGTARKARLLAQVERKLEELDGLIAALQGKREMLLSLLPELRSSVQADGA